MTSKQIGWLIAGYWLLGTGSLMAQAQLAGRWDRMRLAHDAVRYDISVSLPDSGTFITATVATR